MTRVSNIYNNRLAHSPAAYHKGKILLPLTAYTAYRWNIRGKHPQNADNFETPTGRFLEIGGSSRMGALAPHCRPHPRTTPPFCSRAAPLPTKWGVILGWAPPVPHCKPIPERAPILLPRRTCTSETEGFSGMCALAPAPDGSPDRPRPRRPPGGNTGARIPWNADQKPTRRLTTYRRLTAYR